MVTDKLKHDININIAIGLSAASKVWKNTELLWSDLVAKLSTPVITQETYQQFITASKAEQSKIKDVGGFVGGFLNSARRNKTSVLYRQLITLDIDFSHPDFWWDFTMLFDCAAVLHSTHKSKPDKPRHRLIIPLNREVSSEEYQAIARKIAGDLNIALFDKSTFDVSRLMFWPSVSSDIAYDFNYQDGPILDADSILHSYTNWHNINEWPTVESSLEELQSAVKKQEDPTTKQGIIGVFCRTYTIQDAITTFLSDVYEPAGEDRFTYINGTTAAGLITYDDKFAYSHHGTDPAGECLCNAFDLVRIHKFGHLDKGSEKRESDKPSFKAMSEFVAQDPLTKRHIAEEKFEAAKFEFAIDDDISFSKQDADTEKEDTKWVESLEVTKNGEYLSSANNLNIILQNDKFLKDAFKFNIFDNKRYVAKDLPWRRVSGLEPFRDVDYSGIRNYVECVYNISASQKVDDALALTFEKNAYHPIRSYIRGLQWDGKKRVDTLLIDYFGAEDNTYTRAAIRKILCAALARIFEPGTKFDMALILVGPQGTYKSTFVKKLGKDWFSDTFTTVQGKESFEQIQGAWLIEMAELSGLKKAEVETIKHYISKRADYFRPAYGRTVETYKRQCVFFGTTNNVNFLRDPTGNRRFMPIDIRVPYVKKSVMDDLTEDEIDQIWAEVYTMYKAGEALYFNAEENEIAYKAQSKHSEEDERSGLIEDYLDKFLPANWKSLDIFDRRKWLDCPLAEKGAKQRDVVCIAEIWCECLHKDKNDMTRYATRDINDILKALPNWEPVSSTKIFPIYGKQKYYRRKIEEDLW